MPRITPVAPEKLIKVFESFGFTVAQSKGGHVMMTKPGIKRPLVITVSKGDVPPEHILTNSGQRAFLVRNTLKLSRRSDAHPLRQTDSKSISEAVKMTTV